MIRIPQVRLAAPQGQRPTAPFSDVTQTPVTSDPGRDLQQMASTVANVGARLASLDVRAIEQANAGKARQAQGRIREALANQLQGEEGFLHLLGEDAVNNRVAALQKIDDELAKFSGEDVFDNDVQRQLFMQGTQADILRAKVAVQSHGAKQARVFNAATAQASYQADALEIANVGWTIDGEKRLRGDVQAYAEAAGIPKEQTQLIIQTQLSKGLGAHIQTLINDGEFDGAQAALDKAYDPENKDGDKRDKLIGTARSNLNVDLKTKRDAAQKIQTAQEEKDKFNAGQKIAEIGAMHLLSEAMKTTDSLDEGVKLANQGVIDLFNDPDIEVSREQVGRAFETIELQRRGRVRQDDIKQKAALDRMAESFEQATSSMDVVAGLTTPKNLSSMMERFEEYMPEDYAFLNSTPQGKEAMLRKVIAVAKDLEGAEAAAQAKMQMEFDAQYRMFGDPVLFSDDQFREEFPANDPQKIMNFVGHLSMSEQKVISARWAEVHKKPDITPGDTLYANERKQVRTALQGHPWALTDIKDANDVFEVQQELLNNLQDEWTAHQEEVLKGSGNKADFDKWFKSIAEPKDNAWLDQAGTETSRRLLRMAPQDLIRGKQFDRQIAKKGGGMVTFNRNSVEARQDYPGTGGINTSVIDLLLKKVEGIPLPHERQPGQLELSPEQLARGEQLFVDAGSPTWEEANSKTAMNRLKHGDNTLSYHIAQAQVAPEVKRIYEQTMDAGGKVTATEEEQIGLLEEEASLKSAMADPGASEEDILKQRQIYMDRYRLDLHRLRQTVSIAQQWETLLKREREGEMFGILPATGSSPAGWGMRRAAGRPYFGFNYSGFEDYKQQKEAGN